MKRPWRLECEYRPGSYMCTSTFSSKKKAEESLEEVESAYGTYFRISLKKDPILMSKIKIFIV